MSDPNPVPKPDALLGLLVTLLAPLFLEAAGYDCDIARQAAFGTLRSYRVRHPADLIDIARMVGFAMIQLFSLSQSVDGDVSPTLALRFRNSALACDRVVTRIQQHLEARPAPEFAPEFAPDPAPEPAPESAPESEPAAPPEPAAATPAKEISEADRRAAWAYAMTTVVGELATDAADPAASPEDRHAAARRAEVLASTIDKLHSGASLADFAVLGRQAADPPPAG